MGAFVAKHTDMIVGMDMHLIQPPPPAAPMMVPIPIAGMIMDPSDYGPGACTVYVNGLPRARAGSMCMLSPPHTPIGGMFVKPPLNEAEVYQGSSTVTADGEALAALNHQVLGCHDIGVPAPVRAWKSRGAKSLMKAGSLVIALPFGAPVTVGGAPTTSASGQEASEPATRTSVVIDVVDDGGEPFIGARIWVELPDGSMRLAAMGEAPIELPTTKDGDCAVRVFTSGRVRTEPGVHVAGEHEWIGSIAHRYGLDDFELVWRAPENEGLRAKRKSPHLLAAGDEVYVPLPPVTRCATGETHRITLKRARASVSVQLHAPDAAPYSDLEVTMRVGDEWVALAHEDLGHGAVRVEVPPTPCRLRFESAAASFVQDADVGRMPPVRDEDSRRPHPAGIAARLFLLGDLRELSLERALAIASMDDRAWRLVVSAFGRFRMREFPDTHDADGTIDDAALDRLVARLGDT